MKSLSSMVTLSIFTFILFGCEGPQGPPGFDGETLLGTTLEFQTSFNSQNNFSSLFVFPTDVVVYESDVVMAYLLEETIFSNGESTDVWTPLPQSFFTDQGLLQFTFNHTYSDVNVLLQANFNLNNAAAFFTQNQLFRVVIIPAAFANDPSLNTLNYEEVHKRLGTEDSTIIRGLD